MAAAADISDPAQLPSGSRGHMPRIFHLLVIVMILQLFASSGVGCAGCVGSVHENVGTVKPDAHSVSGQQSAEMLPAGVMESPAGVNDVLAVYAKLTGATLEVEESVHQIQGAIPFPPSYPAMTKAQACDFLEVGLRKAGVAITHPDANHVIFKLQR